MSVIHRAGAEQVQKRARTCAAAVGTLQGGTGSDLVAAIVIALRQVTVKDTPSAVEVAYDFDLL